MKGTFAGTASGNGSELTSDTQVATVGNGAFAAKVGKCAAPAVGVGEPEGVGVGVNGEPTGPVQATWVVPEMTPAVALEYQFGVVFSCQKTPLTIAMTLTLIVAV